MQYITIVNEVLKRLRELSVDDVNATPYSSLIGAFVNEAKREVEDAHNWSVLEKDINLYTMPGVRDYALPNTNHRTVINYSYNLSRKWFLENTTKAVLVKLQDLNFSPVYNQCLRYTLLRREQDGVIVVRIDPYPSTGETLVFNCKVPQDDLVVSSDYLWIPSEPVILKAYALAIAERGEDQGQGSMQAEEKYKSSLRDHIAIDANGNDHDSVWTAT